MSEETKSVYARLSGKLSAYREKNGTLKTVLVGAGGFFAYGVVFSAFSFGLMVPFVGQIIGAAAGLGLGIAACVRHNQANPLPKPRSWEDYIRKATRYTIKILGSTVAGAGASLVPIPGLNAVALGGLCTLSDQVTSIGSVPKKTFSRNIKDLLISCVPGFGSAFYLRYQNVDLDTGKALPGVPKKAEKSEERERSNSGPHTVERRTATPTGPRRRSVSKDAAGAGVGGADTRKVKASSGNPFAHDVSPGIAERERKRKEEREKSKKERS
ncbi:MAG: hypothetical protein RLN62_05610 [Rickettsiales bacterium]